MDKIKELVEKHKKEIGLVALGTAITGTLLYFTLRGGKKTNKGITQTIQNTVNEVQNKANQIIPNNTQNIQQTKHKQNSDAKNINQKQIQIEQQQPRTQEQIIKSVLPNIQVSYIGNTNCLELFTITQVLEKSILLAAEPYRQLTISNREQRRKLMHNNTAEYEQFIYEYNEKVEQILIEAQETLLLELGIEQEIFENSVLQLMEKGLFQQMYMIQAAIRQKIKETIPAKNLISVEKTIEVIQYQLQILQNRPEILADVIQKLQGNIEAANQIPSFVNMMLQDLIFEKFGIEEEDQMKNMHNPEILNQPDVQEILFKIEEAMFQLMGNLGVGMAPNGFSDDQ